MHTIGLALDSLLVVLVVPDQIQSHYKLGCLPVVVTVLEDLPLSLYLAKVLFTHISRCISPFLGCFTSLIEVLPDHSGMFLDLGCHITIYWHAIYYICSM
jgi:hypothetical protein